MEKITRGKGYPMIIFNMYGKNIITPNMIESIALSSTAPALTSLAYFIFTLYSCDTVSHTASITLLNASEINTNAIKNPTAIQSE